MSLMVPIMMFGWIPVILFLFSRYPARRAVIISFLFAWLFLPVASYPIPGLPNYTKMSATCWGILIAAAIFDSGRLMTFRPKVIDLPIVIWCFCPLASSLLNGLGFYDGIATTLTQIVTWGFPYLIGRIYFSDLEGLREFAIGIIIGGIVYVPLCLFEIRMSPQLHYRAYGFMQHDFAQTIRFGGYRPMVFMQHGLAVGMWMAGASLVGAWLWISGSVKKLLKIPVSYWAILLIITTILCKSTGAIALLFTGLFSLFIAYKIRTKLILITLLIIPVFYLPVRAPGLWDGEGLASFIYTNFDAERGLSLWTRFNNENMLTEKAMERPIFGWGGWGRSRIYDEMGNDISVTDSLWIIVFGQNGFTGLISLTLSILLPCFVLLKRYKTKEWFHPNVIPAVTLMVLLSLYMIDNLLNAMINPIYMGIAGGVISLERESLEDTKEQEEYYDDLWFETSCKTRFL